MKKEDIQLSMTEFVYAKFPLAEKKGMTPRDPLLESGVVDSMGILEIVTHIENEYSIQLTDEEVLADTFQSIESITELIAAKKMIDGS